MAYLEHDGRTRRRIADTLVLAAVAIHHYSLRGFTEWLAKRVGSFDGDRGGMHHARAAALLGATSVRVEILRHVRLPPPVGTYFDGTCPDWRGQWNGDTSSKQAPLITQIFVGFREISADGGTEWEGSAWGERRIA